MAYGDRFSMQIKDFGRKVVITVNRGVAKCSDDGKLVTITYKDAKVRNIPKGTKPVRP
jgi:hypothetical protein